MSSVPRPALKAPSSTPDTPSGGAEGSSKNRRVNFPNDDLIVSGYLEPPNPWEKASDLTPEELVAAYAAACEKHNVRPLPKLLHQLKHINVFGDREECLSLKGEKLDPKHCETMEEIFKRVQFRTIDVESTYLDDEGSVALFDMIEYYESAENLNISNNKNISSRGWQACARMIKKTGCLETLEARNSCMDEQTMAILCRTLRTNTNLMVLHLENCGISGRAFTILMTSMKLNSHLQELYLGYNRLSSSDAVHLGQLLAVNTSLQVLDLRHNHIQDSGVAHLVDGLLDQPTGMGGGLQSLVLFNNQLNHTSAMHLAKAVANTKTLQHLNLGNNNLTNDGVFSLKDALMKNRTLNYLGLQGTKITCEGAITLAECFADNSEIQHLDLRDNSIRIAGLLALSLSMKVNSSIQELDLDKELKKGTKEQQEQHHRLIAEILEHCDRNKKVAEEKEAEEECLRHLAEEKNQAILEPEEKLSESVCRLLSLWDHSPPSPRLTHSPSPTLTEKIPECSSIKEKLPTENKFRSKFRARSSASLDDKDCELPIIVIPAGEKSNIPSLSVDLPPSSPQPVNPALLSPPPVSPSPTKSRFRVSRVMLDAESPSSSAGNTPMPSPVPSPGNTPVPSPTVTPVPSPGCTPLPSPVPSPVGSPVSSPCHSPMGNGSHAPPSSPVLNRAIPVRHGFICGTSAATVPAHNAMISSSPPIKPPRTDLAAFAMMTLAAKNARDGTKAPPCTPSDLSPLGFQKSVINGIFAPPPSPADSDLSSKQILPSSTNLLLPSPEEDISCSSSSSSSSNPDTNNTVITPPLSPIDDDSLSNQEFSSIIATLPSSPNDVSSLHSDSLENDSDSLLSSVNSICVNDLQTSPSYAASTVSMATFSPTSLEESSSSNDSTSGNVFTFNTDELLCTPSESYVSSISDSVPSISCSDKISTSTIKLDNDLLVPPNSPLKVVGPTTSSLIGSDSLSSNHTSTLLQFWNVLWGSPTLPKQSDLTTTSITPNESGSEIQSLSESCNQSISDVSLSIDSGVETPDYNLSIDSGQASFYPLTEGKETPNKVSVPSENLNFPFEIVGSVAPPSSPVDSLASVRGTTAPPTTPNDGLFSQDPTVHREQDFIESCIMTHLIKSDMMNDNSTLSVPHKTLSEHLVNKGEADKCVQDSLNADSLSEKSKNDPSLAVSEPVSNDELQPLSKSNTPLQSSSPDFLSISNQLSQPIKKNTSISLPSSPSKQPEFSHENTPTVKSLSKDDISEASSNSAKAINSKYRIIKLAEPSCVRLFGGGIPNSIEKKENPTILLSSPLPSNDTSSPVISSDVQTVSNTSHSTDELSSFQVVENIQNSCKQNSRFTIVNISRNDPLVNNVPTSDKFSFDSENLKECNLQPKLNSSNVKENFVLEVKDDVKEINIESHSENQFIDPVPETLSSENNEATDSFLNQHSDSDVNGNLNDKPDLRKDNFAINNVLELKDNCNKLEDLAEKPTVLRRVKLPSKDKQNKDRRASTGSFFGMKQEHKKESSRRISLTVDELIQQQLIELHNSFKLAASFKKEDSIDENSGSADQKSLDILDSIKTDFSNSLTNCQKKLESFCESNSSTINKTSENANTNILSKESSSENGFLSSDSASETSNSTASFISDTMNLTTEDSNTCVGLSRDSENVCVENKTNDAAENNFNKVTDFNEHSCNLDSNYNCNLECVEKKGYDFLSNVPQTDEINSYCQCCAETHDDRERQIDTDNLQKSVNQNSIAEGDELDCTREESALQESVKSSETCQKDLSPDTIHATIVENGNMDAPCDDIGISHLHSSLDTFRGAVTTEFSSPFLPQKEVPSEPVIVRQRLVGSVAPSLGTSNEEALNTLPGLIGNLSAKEEEGGGYSSGSLPLSFLEDSTTSSPCNNNGLLCFLEGLNLKNGTTTSPILESDMNVSRAAQDGTTSVLQT